MLKTLSYLIFTGFLTLGICSGCQSDSTTKAKHLSDNSSRSDELIIDSKPESKFNRQIAEIAIINNTLPFLVPHRVITESQEIPFQKHDQHNRSVSANHQKLIDSLGMTLYVNDFMLSATEKTIKGLIEKGADPLLMTIAVDKWKDKLFNTRKLMDFDGIHVGSDAPFTKDDKNRNIGGINFSRIVFSEDKTRAVFIYDFERFHNQYTSLFCAVEVEIQKEKWVIISKTCNNPID